MKKNILKFRNINFPIFTLKKKPYSIVYDASKICVVLEAGSHKQTVDDKTLPGDYFARLFQLTQRVSFDYTCKNLQDLISTGSKWGMDAKAIPHDFSKLEAVPVEKRLVVKVDKNLVWLKNISYPFELLTNENLQVNDKLYATIVYVNGEWFLKEFSFENSLSRPYVYV